MIFYVIANNPDDRILKRAKDLMDNGGVISFPTDTNWVLAVSPFSKKGVDALYRFKGDQREKHFSLICNSISEGSSFGYISDAAFRKINRLVPGPYTFIFSPTKKLPAAIKSYQKDKQIGLRFPDSILSRRLIEANGFPLLSTSVSWEMLRCARNADSTIYGYLIEEYLEMPVDIILDPGEVELLGPSSVVDFSADDGPIILRYGSGDLSSFHS